MLADLEAEGKMLLAALVIRRPPPQAKEIMEVVAEMLVGAVEHLKMVKVQPEVTVEMAQRLQLQEHQLSMLAAVLAEGLGLAPE